MIRASFLLTMAALVLSPLYLWESGLPQLAHLVMALAIACHVSYLALRRTLTWDSWWIWGVLFAAYALAINLIVYVAHGDTHTLLSSMYYVFNVLVFIHLSTLATKVGTHRFLRTLWVIFWLLLIVQTILLIAGVGSQYGGTRIVGTFNDPNQAAHWIMWMVVCLMAIGWSRYRSWTLGTVAWGIGVIAVAFTASRSGGLALFWLAIVQGYHTLKVLGAIFLRGCRLSKRWLTVGLLAIMIVIGAGVASPTAVQASAHRLAERFASWVDRFQERNFYTTLEGRGYDRLYKFPEYLALGAGEGANHRWAGRTRLLNEIHSTVAGVIFYYGLPGFLCWALFILNLFIRLNSVWLRLLLLAPFAYSVGTYNLRNWFFWVGMSILWMASSFHDRGRSSEARR